MPIDATDLGERLLDAQVAYLAAELTGPAAAEVVEGFVGGVLAALEDVTVSDLVDREALRATVATGIERVGPSSAVAELVTTMTRAIYELPTSDEHQLGDIVDRAHVERIVDELANSESLREELLRRLGRSPAVAALSMRFVSSLVGDAVQQNRTRAEKVPGAKLAFGMGDFAARQARGLAPKQLEKAIGGAADKGAQAAMERVTRALVETLDPAAVRTAVMEVWDLHAGDSVAGLRAYLTTDEVAGVAGAGHDVWLGLHEAAWFTAAVDAAIDAFLDRYGSGTVGELLRELGLDTTVLLAEVQRHAPRLHAALHASGHLEAILRDRLAPFFGSDAFTGALGADA